MNSRGFTLLETIIYAGLLPLILLVVFQVAFSETNAWLRARAERNATDGAIALLDRITQEIRLASSVSVVSSTFDASPGRLVLETVRTPTSTSASAADIAMVGTDVRISRDGNASTTLVGTHIRVTNLTFTNLTVSSAEAVRISATVESGAGRFLREKQFTTAVVLRGSY
jgi:type II secretory pathway pseudopilin PulG